jgi:hypothetical protein
MKKTIDHLLTPRFEVIGDYPDSILEVGKIVLGKMCYVLESTKVDLTDFPHLFKPLNWWEYRKEEDMPEYLKIDNVKMGLKKEPDFSYYKVVNWRMNIMFGEINGNSGCSLLSFSPEYTYQPCSEEEYLLNQK